MKALNTLKKIIVSDSRVKLLQELFYVPTEMYYVRELTRATGEKLNSVRRELKNLESAGLLKSEWRGNKLFYRANIESPLFQDVLSMILKTKGLGKHVIDARHKLGKIKFAFFTGRYARNTQTDKEMIDLLVVGEVIFPEIGALVRQEEKKRKKEINYTVMKQDDFRFRKEKKDPFLIDILTQGRIMIIGDDQQMADY